MTPAEIRRFGSKITEFGDGCWLWQGSVNNAGRAVFWLEGRQQFAARLALSLDGREAADPDLMACHHCDNPRCVRPSHLYWGTHADNMRDRMERGRTARGDRMPHRRISGEAHPKAKLTEANVREIRASYRPGLGGELMRRFGISQASLWAIVNGRTWRSLETAEDPHAGHIDPCSSVCHRAPSRWLHPGDPGYPYEEVE